MRNENLLFSISDFLVRLNIGSELLISFVLMCSTCLINTFHRTDYDGYDGFYTVL